MQVDIAALSETRLAEEGQLKEGGAGYTFFWRRPVWSWCWLCCKKRTRHQAEQRDINDRLMTLKLSLSEGKQATIISAYASTMTNPDDRKEKFYPPPPPAINKDVWTEIGISSLFL